MSWSAVRCGVSWKAQPTARHMSNGRGLDVSEHWSPLDRCIQRLMDGGNLANISRISKILSKMDMVRKISESLILERKKKIGTHNARYAWMVAGVTIAGYLFGTALVTFPQPRKQRGEKNEDRILQDKKRLGLEE